MVLNQRALLPILTLLIVVLIILSGCIETSKHKASGDSVFPYTISDEKNGTSPISEPGAMKNLTDTEVRQIIAQFTLQSNIPNLTYNSTVNTQSGILYTYQSDGAIFVVNSVTGRVQSATGRISAWRLPKSSVNQSCSNAGTFASGIYPDLWNATERHDMRPREQKIQCTLASCEFCCTWYKIYYNPSKIVIPNYTVQDRNSVTMIIEPSSGAITSYEELYSPLSQDLNLTPILSEKEALGYAKLYLEKAGSITNDPQSDVENYGLFVSTDEENKQHLIWSMLITQTRNGIDYGGIVGIDAHDGQVVWHGTIG